MTQVDLAKKIGVTPNAVTQWESGDRKPSLINLKKLSQILGCTTDELLKPIQI